jgi:hypothetical protein
MQKKYFDLHRHWCPHSEKYTGCDSLITAMEDGYRVYHTVTYQIVWRNGRAIRLYTFMLARHGVIAPMHVVHNPYLTRLIDQMGWTVVTPAALPHLVVDVMRYEGFAAEA